MRTKFLFLALLTSTATLSALAQTPNDNQAAVDTLTKEVAKAVFSTINQPKAQEIYSQLLTCGDGCDARDIIRTVGSWDQVGQRIEDLSTLKNTKNFVSMAPADANAAIRQQLAQFYQKNKPYASYAKALPPAVQQGILAKIDVMLPPNATATTADDDTPPSDDPAVEDAQSPGVTSGETGGDNISGSAMQVSKLERDLNEAKDKQMWMLLGGLLAGLIVGAGGMYMLAKKRYSDESDAYDREIRQLSAELDSERRKAKPAPSTSRTNPARETVTQQTVPRPTASAIPPTPSTEAQPPIDLSKPARSGDVSMGDEPALVQFVPEPAMPVSSQQSQSFSAPLRLNLRAVRFSTARPRTRTGSSTPVSERICCRPNRPIGSVSMLLSLTRLRFVLKRNPADWRGCSHTATT
ncbi:hypothetical protein [Spirosoma rhododendri]|uniref:hypothetical protein n=1 Tax=Spirosoma rhododendri TaxID=2728024 RepID=UPI0020C5A03E|nr:hypothetical protein [Spirosoma rhododendri]